MSSTLESESAATSPGWTPSQTIGPFFRFGLEWLAARELVPAGSLAAVALSGQVTDGDGAPVPDAAIEVYLPGPDGPRFGRSLTDEEGRYHFTAAKPEEAGDGQAPHLEVSVFARGLLQRLWTRIYFPDETAANNADPLLNSVGDADRVATLVACAGDNGLVFDIRLQGNGETVFLEW